MQSWLGCVSWLREQLALYDAKESEWRTRECEMFITLHNLPPNTIVLFPVQLAS